MLNNDDFALNILILGRIGVGKSSLINAILGREVAETEVIEPITGEGIYKYEVNIDGIKMNIHESWGIEIGKEDRCKNLIDSELSKTTIHSITYCICGAMKIADLDIKIIKKFLNEKYNVTVVLTKADTISEYHEKEFINTIKQATGIETVITVAAAPELMRGQEKPIEPFGLDEYKKAILSSYKRVKMCINIEERLKDYIKNCSEKDLNILSNDILNEIEKYKD